MSYLTTISWTDHTFNIVDGCEKVSPGCKNCYAERMSARYGRENWGHNAPRQTLSESYWAKLDRWQRNAAKHGAGCYPHNQAIRLVFCGSMCDVFEDHATVNAERVKLWECIRACPNLHFQLLTKRPENIERMLPDGYPNGYENVWLGTSIENNVYAHRADYLRNIPAAARFISYEPALGPLDDLDLTGIDWVIYGGESGPNYRRHNLQWPRDMRDRCAAAGVAFFYKQSPAPRTEMGIELDGQIIRQFPRLRHERTETRTTIQAPGLF